MNSNPVNAERSVPLETSANETEPETLEATVPVGIPVGVPAEVVDTAALA